MIIKTIPINTYIFEDCPMKRYFSSINYEKSEQDYNRITAKIIAQQRLELEATNT